MSRSRLADINKQIDALTSNTTEVNQVLASINNHAKVATKYSDEGLQHDVIDSLTRFISKVNQLLTSADRKTKDALYKASAEASRLIGVGTTNLVEIQKNPPLSQTITAGSRSSSQASDSGRGSPSSFTEEELNTRTFNIDNRTIPLAPKESKGMSGLQGDCFEVMDAIAQLKADNEAKATQGSDLSKFIDSITDLGAKVRASFKEVNQKPDEYATQLIKIKAEFDNFVQSQKGKKVLDPATAKVVSDYEKTGRDFYTDMLRKVNKHLISPVSSTSVGSVSVDDIDKEVDQRNFQQTCSDVVKKLSEYSELCASGKSGMVKKLGRDLDSASSDITLNRVKTPDDLSRLVDKVVRTLNTFVADVDVKHGVPDPGSALEIKSKFIGGAEGVAIKIRNDFQGEGKQFLENKVGLDPDRHLNIKLD